MIATKSLWLGLFVIGGWTNSPTVWATPLEASATTSLKSEQIAATEQTSTEESPATTVDDWMAQIEATKVQITGVSLNTTETGLQVFLETVEGTLATPTTILEGNVLTADIPNAVLVLPEGKVFDSANPVVGIKQVTVTSLPGDQVRVMVSGTDTPPLAKVTSTAAGLTFSITPGSQDLAEMEDADLEITVTAEEKEEGYNPSNASTATRTDTPLRDIPQSIQVVPKAVIEDQGVTRIGDALRNVSGVTPQRDFAGSNFRFTTRGLENSSLLRNGFRSGTDTFSAATATNTVERIEVLKGPASVLYGQTEPGGLVNLVTKKPQKEPSYNFSFAVGSFGLIEPAIDLTGPLTEDKKLTYRLTASYQTGGSFRDFVDSTILSISPVISYDFSDNTNLTFEYEYLQDDRTFDEGLPIDPITFDLPRERFLSEPNDFFNNSLHRFNLTLEHRFNENIKLRSRFGSEINNDLLRGFRPFEFDPESGNLSRVFADDRSFDDNLSWQTDLITEFKTGPIEHKLLAGFELARTSFGFNDLSTSTFVFNPENNPLTINVFNPQYGTPIPSLDERNGAFQSVDTVSTLGFYLQDQITLLPNLKLLVGGRYDLARNDSEFISVFNGETSSGSSEFNSEAFSPRVGLVYQPIEPISLYGSFSRSFRPNSVSTSNGDIIEPERGTQYEIGARGEFGNVVVNLAAYDITKTNLTRTDPADPDFSIPIGKVRSRGIELDVAGQPVSGWNIIGSLFFNDASISEGDEFNPEGDILINAPGSGASLWTTYEIQKGDLQGLGFGAGLFYVGDREAELPNNFVLPSYVRADASIFYKRDNWQVQLNFQNLFDTNYFESSQNTSLIYPGAPFTVIGKVSVQF